MSDRSLKRSVHSFALFLLIRSFQKSDLAIALVKRAIERAIAQLLFLNERLSNPKSDRSFEKSNQKSNCSVAH